MRGLAILFFVSGMPALIYQIVWQRSLFSIYGVNIESVTVVVTAFMLGLGLGSMVGGKLSKQTRMPRLVLFGLIEIGIGVFGWVSLAVFDAVAVQTAGASALTTGLATFSLLLVPTLLMGATLPILTAHLVERSRHVGKSVGLLYFANTLGSGVACSLAAMVFMRMLGLSGSVRLAAVLNVAVGLVAIFVLSRKAVSSGESALRASEPVDTSPRLSMRIAALLAVWSGFIALAYEIVWYRAFSYVSGGAPQCFSFLLGAYLVGLAYGSLYSRKLATRSGTAMLHPISGFALFANAIGLLVLPALGALVTFAHYSAVLPLVALAAAGLGGVFPLVCHATLPPDARAGGGLAKLYFLNIIGAALGSFLTGYVLLDHLSLANVSLLLGALGLIGVVVIWALGSTRAKQWIPAAAVASFALMLVAKTPLFGGLYEKLQFKHDYDGQRYARIVETRSGVVTLTQEDGLYTIYGGGIYDGKFNTRLDNDVNGIFRLYSVSALHRNPERVLVIGVGSGSWTQVLANHPQIKHIDAIEINPGYLEVIRESDVVKSILTNPKIRMHIDDGRRWLRSHPDETYDAIIMNTTFHWRAHASGLLSADFLRIARKHLRPGGFLFYNTTLSPAVAVTGARVFEHAVRIESFMAVSDSPFPLDRAHWRSILQQYTQPASIPAEAIESLLARFDTIGTPLGTEWKSVEGRDSILKRFADAETITDDNMATEWILRW